MSSKAREIIIARDFSSIPGARYIKDGPFSGELFRQMHLIPHFSGVSEPQEVVINLDGAAGYATSFLEEAFGGLAREIGKAKVRKYVSFVCNEDPFIVEEIWGYIDDVG